MEKDFKEVLADIKSGAIPLTQQIGHISYYLISKTAYSFHFYTVYERNGKDVLSEMLYDLRNREYYIKRNGKQVVFSYQNLDTVMPRKRLYHSSGFGSQANTDAFLEMVSVEENKGMYKEMADGVGSLGLEKIGMLSRALVRLITEYNKLELLYKAGIEFPSDYGRANYYTRSKFYKMVYDASQKNIRKVHEVFGLTKSQYKFFREFEGDKITDKFLDRRLYAAKLTQQDMDRYRGLLKYIEELGEKYDVQRLEVFQNSTSLEAYMKSIVDKREGRNNNWIDIFQFIEEFDHSNELRLIEYLLFECYVSQGCQYSTALQEYRDYYRMCMDLQYERFDKYPRYLKTAHDIVTMNYKLVEDKVTLEKFKKKTEEYRHLETVVGDFAICVPGETIELVNEGNVLQHCVGSYVRNVSAGKTRIMFLREKKDTETPLVTVELRGDEITQARGFSNRKVTQDERLALHKFAKKQNLKVKSHV